MRVAAALAALLLATASAAQEQAPAETIAADTDATDRMTVPVSIGGRGPYRFMIDTGAERTAIARELAADLGLGPGRTAVVHSMSEVSRVPTVIIPALEVGRRTVSDIHAPALDRLHLGAEGLLGVDSLRSQRVELDFVRNEMTVVPARRPEPDWPGDTIVIRARSRFGHLMLVDASFEGERVWVIVDTGAELTMANNALRRRLSRHRRLGPTSPIEMVSVTGGRLVADLAVARQIRIGGMTITDMPVAFADAQPFHHLDLLDRPALLLGMNALRLFERASFDFATRRVRLMVRSRSQLRRDTRLAAP